MRLQDGHQPGRVASKGADPSCQLVVGGAIAGQLPAEGRLIQVRAIVGAGPCSRLRLQHPWQRRLIRRQRLQQRRRDGHAVGARQGADLVQRVVPRGAAPAGRHADGGMAVPAEVGVHGCARLHARVLRGRVHRAALGAIRIKLAPLQDAAWKGRDEVRIRLGSRHRLALPEHQRDVAPDAIFLQGLCTADALPRAGQLDEHTLAPHAHRLVQVDDASRASL
mmetsp:Transcript_19486/g.49006  ORF Transcript_19486/g.49006 Transcript_19486/m.49006 type:complete len:222 (+) Transcript_19486:205-870(+)